MSVRSEFGEYMVNARGESLGRCQITVFKGGTEELATIYSTKSGVLKTNPFENESDGYASFVADPGMYTIWIADLASPQRFGKKEINWSAVSGASQGIPSLQLENENLPDSKLAIASVGAAQYGPNSVESVAYPEVKSPQLAANSITASKIARLPGAYMGNSYYTNPSLYFAQQLSTNSITSRQLFFITPFWTNNEVDIISTPYAMRLGVAGVYMVSLCVPIYWEGFQPAAHYIFLERMAVATGGFESEQVIASASTAAVSNPVASGLPSRTLWCSALVVFDGSTRPYLRARFESAGGGGTGGQVNASYAVEPSLCAQMIRRL